MDELQTSFETTQYVKIDMGEEQYGIDIKYIDNIVRMQNITRVPKVPKYFMGVINLRGEVVPVMSLRLKMGLADDVITKSTRIIILKVEAGSPIGIIVDQVREVINLDSNSIEKVYYDAKDEKTNFLAGVGKDKDNLVSLLDLNIVLAEKTESAV